MVYQPSKKIYYHENGREQQFFDQLQAPSKEWLIFDRSANSPNYEELEKFTKIVVSKVS
jgi:hypothetical protein